MKRCLKILCCLCAAVLLLTSVAYAEGAREMGWYAYCMEENAAGELVEGTPPAMTYTDRGLEIAGHGRDTYTVQTEDRLAVGEELYLELTVEDPSRVGVVVLHLWNQKNMLYSNLHCGSGWYGMISVRPNGEALLIHVNVSEATADRPDGEISVLGTLPFTAPLDEKGGATLTMEIRSGLLFINGSVVGGSEKMTAYLEEVAPEGVYLGVSMLASDSAEESSPMTLTRYGADKASATVPAPDGDNPETQPPATEAPDTPPATEAPDTPPATEAPDTPPATEAPDTPPATEAPNVPPATEAPDVPPATEAPNVPPATKPADEKPADPAETEGGDAGFDKFQSLIEGGGCGSSLGVTAALLPMLLGGLLLVLKRKEG